MNTTFVSSAICFLRKMVSFTFKGRVNRTARPLFCAVADYFFFAALLARLMSN